MVIHVGWLPPQECWDQNTLAQLFANRLYPTGLQFRRHDTWPPDNGAIIVIPGRHWHERTDQLNAQLGRYEWVLAIRVSDEEDWLAPTAISHPNIAWWVQTPRTDTDYGAAYLFGVGYTPAFNTLGGPPPRRSTDVFIAAQDTHERRHECFETLLASHHNALIYRTKNFAACDEGVSTDVYATMMTTAKVAPAPAGPATPDTFRTYEALAAHTIPIADDITIAYDSRGYWRRLYPNTPMPVIEKYSDLPGYIDDALRDYPRAANRITAWWIGEKRRMARRLRADLRALGASC